MFYYGPWWAFSPFRFIWVLFLALVVFSFFVNAYATNGQYSVLISAGWAVWGVLWIFLLVPFFVFGWRHRNWNHHFTGKEMAEHYKDIAINRAKIRLASGELSEKEYLRIIRQIKR